MTKIPKVAVVILNWNGIAHLREFLPSVLTSVWPNLEIIIGDNASTDGSVYFINTEYPSVKVIQNDQNYGFTGGYNRVLEQVDADYFILLNSDVEVFPGWIAPIINLMESDPLIAVAAPKIKAYLQKGYFEHAGAAGGYIDSFGYPFCRGRMFYEIEKDNGQYQQSGEVFWASGAAMFIKKHCWIEANGFDECFFAHMEEIDLCWRLKNKGYKIMYCAESEVYHLGGGTLNVENPFKTYLNFRNNLLLLKNNLPFWQAFFVISARFLMDLMAIIRFLNEGKRKDAWAVSRAHQYFVLSLFKFGGKRLEVGGQRLEVGSKKLEVGGQRSEVRGQEAASVSQYSETIKEEPNTGDPHHATRHPLKGMYRGSIVWAFFVKKKKYFTALKPADFI